MAIRPPPVGGYVQDLPPKGGFPIVKYRKTPLQRGPSGLAIVLGGVALTAWGLYRSYNDNLERRCVLPCAVVLAVELSQGGSRASHAAATRAWPGLTRGTSGRS